MLRGMTTTSVLAAVVALLCCQLIGASLFVLATAGLDGWLAAASLAVVGIGIGLPAVTVAGSPRRRGRRGIS